MSPNAAVNDSGAQHPGCSVSAYHSECRFNAVIMHLHFRLKYGDFEFSSLFNDFLVSLSEITCAYC